MTTTHPEEDYGPVDLVTIGFGGDRPPTGVVQAIARLAENDTITILDLALVRRHVDGSVESIELENLGDDEKLALLGLEALELEVAGLAGEDDLEMIAEELEPGHSAIVAAVELTWARGLTRAIAEAGAYVVSEERIPAWVVNEVLTAEQNDEP